jgi:hypothetical protein
MTRYLIDIMLFAFTLGLCLIGAAGWYIAVAYRLDRVLRRLMPSPIESRLRQRLFRDPRLVENGLEPSDPALEAGLIPLRWQRQYFHTHGAVVVDRFWAAVANALLFAATGVFLVALALAFR